MLQTTVLVVAAFALWSVGCAKIADPQPPELRIPKPAADMAARQISDFIALSFSLPTQNTNGSSVSTLQRVEIFRFTEDKKVAGNELPHEAEFFKQALPIQSIPSSDFAKYLHGSTFFIQDRLRLPSESSIYSHSFVYAVLFVNKKNQTAGFSNQARINPVPIPPPPEGLSAEVKEDSIQLR
jgi:hypothetical protein